MYEEEKNFDDCASARAKTVASILRFTKEEQERKKRERKMFSERKRLKLCSRKKDSMSHVGVNLAVVLLLLLLKLCAQQGREREFAHTQYK